MNGCPLQLHLPGGVIADYVSESDPPQYAVNGEVLAVDVVIPPDLEKAGWIWHGSTLTQPWPNGTSIGVGTATFPPPGYPNDRQTCFDAAREIEKVRAEHDAALAARPVKPAKTRKARPAPPVLVQAAMEL